MKFFFITMILTLAAGCSTMGIQQGANANWKVTEEESEKSNDECCAHVTADGKCAHELIPGCWGGL